MHAVLDAVLPHPLLRDRVLVLLRDAKEAFEVLSCKASDDRLRLETPELARDDRCMVEVFIILILLVLISDVLRSEKPVLGIVSCIVSEDYRRRLDLNAMIGFDFDTSLRLYIII
jgi:hypothetical protein